VNNIEKSDDKAAQGADEDEATPIANVITDEAIEEDQDKPKDPEVEKPKGKALLKKSRKDSEF
jgi:hypothetical protein